MIEVTDASFRQDIFEPSKQGVLFLIVIYAAWCPDSKRMLAVIQQIEKDYAGLVNFAKIEAERRRGEIKNPFTQKAFEVTKFPKLIIFQNGKVMAERISDGDASEQMEDAIELIDYYF